MQLVTFERRRPTASGSGLLPADPGSMGSAALGMESLESVWPGSRRLGAVLPPGPHAGDIVDLNRALAIKLAFDDAGAPEAEADSLLPPTALEFLRCFDRALEAAHTALEWVLEALGRYDDSLTWLEKAYEEEDWTLKWMMRSHMFDSVRDTPRFKAIMDGLGLEEEGYFDKAGSAI